MANVKAELVTNAGNTSQLEGLLVGTSTVSSFFNTVTAVSLPVYQRPYVWGEEKLLRLFQDLEEHFFFEKKYKPEAGNYYLGTILLYKDGNNKYEIIDGQQRVSSLLLVNHAWKGKDSFLSKDKWDLRYRSLLSAAVLRRNFNLIKEYPKKNTSYLSDRIDDIFSKLVITIIITQDKDEAFTFFDSQNNRGVRLSAVDFLKSYHLRDLKGEGLQAVFARQWDKNNTDQALNSLFNQTLWRGRKWRGKDLYFEYKDAILAEFQKATIPSTSKEVNLYPNVFNTLASKLCYEKEGPSIQLKSLSLRVGADQYPFSLRQPIQKGLGFFLYTEKYYAIDRIIFKEEQLTDLSLLFNTLYSGVSDYLRSFFKLGIIAYYDKYKEEKIVEFALWLDYLLGSYRMKRYSIVAQTIIIILRDNSQNLLDVIEMAYRSEEIFDFIKGITNDDDYKDQDHHGGVRWHYRQNNLRYFKKENTETLANKLRWINGKLN